jgi:hypothetical protein
MSACVHLEHSRCDGVAHGGCVEKITNEQSSEVMQVKNPCIMLGGVVRRGEYSEKTLLCPRVIPSFWKEIWLTPAKSDTGTKANGFQRVDVVGDARPDTPDRGET